MGNVVDVVIIGAGPYGLSVAAHLKQRGVAFRIFGKPMQTWKSMPHGMFLKSFGFATNIYTPDDRHGFVAYCLERGLESHEPCAIADFAHYGLWAQKELIAELEDVHVANVSRAADGFGLLLTSGQTLRARRVVIAVGTKYFARMPRGLAALPRDLASHTSQHSEYQSFAGKDVCVVGAGQSAFEAARLLLEAGARPQLLVRASEISFSRKMPTHRSVWARIRSPQSGLGPGLKSWVIETLPLLPHVLPDDWRLSFLKTHLGPGGAWWLRDRIVGKLPILTNCTIAHAAPEAGRLSMVVSEKNASDRHVVCDHVIAGTGYEVDIDRLDFLDTELRRSILRIERGPALDSRFQSSVSGLFFVGLASSLSFGPLFRFVAGAAFTSRALSQALAHPPKVRSASFGLPLHAKRV